MNETASVNVVYTYDERNRLTSADYGDGRKITYAYDAAGNRIRVARQTPPLAEAAGAPRPMPPEPKLPGPPDAPVPPELGPAPPPAQVPGQALPFGGEKTLVLDSTLEILPLTLLVEEGGREGQSVTLIKGGSLGRQAGNEILLDDPGVSRRHAFFTLGDGGRWFVADTGSSNGTFVNGEKISEPTPLKVGDKVQAGTTVLRVVTEA